MNTLSSGLGGAAGAGLGTLAGDLWQGGGDEADQEATPDQATPDQATPDQESEPAPAAPRTSASDGDDYMDELERLAKLRNEGVITQDDYDRKKQQLLGI
ncbi:MAG TPA: SHOCT domain-containing protein [Solirubrobacterales bacterium]|nr:SHOCT domain-containing protein [Thermoleophilia bacterium]HVO54580.1 SHOCT domain-containing protein [Solirubrobacterales bacterium]